MFLLWYLFLVTMANAVQEQSQIDWNTCGPEQCYALGKCMKNKSINVVPGRRADLYEVTSVDQLIDGKCDIGLHVKIFQNSFREDSMIERDVYIHVQIQLSGEEFDSSNISEVCLYYGEQKLFGFAKNGKGVKVVGGEKVVNDWNRRLETVYMIEPFEGQTNNNLSFCSFTARNIYMYKQRGLYGDSYTTSVRYIKNGQEKIIFYEESEKNTWIVKNKYTKAKLHCDPYYIKNILVANFGTHVQRVKPVLGKHRKEINCDDYGSAYKLRFVTDKNKYGIHNQYPQNGVLTSIQCDYKELNWKLVGGGPDEPLDNNEIGIIYKFYCEIPPHEYCSTNPPCTPPSSDHRCPQSTLVNGNSRQLKCEENYDLYVNDEKINPDDVICHYEGLQESEFRFQNKPLNVVYCAPPNIAPIAPSELELNCNKTSNLKYIRQERIDLAPFGSEKYCEFCKEILQIDDFSFGPSGNTLQCKNNTNALQWDKWDREELKHECDKKSGLWVSSDSYKIPITPNSSAICYMHRKNSHFYESYKSYE